MWDGNHTESILLWETIIFEYTVNSIAFYWFTRNTSVSHITNTKHTYISDLYLTNKITLLTLVTDDNLGITHIVNKAVVKYNETVLRMLIYAERNTTVWLHKGNKTGKGRVTTAVSLRYDKTAFCNITVLTKAFNFYAKKSFLLYTMQYLPSNIDWRYFDISLDTAYCKN